MREHQYGAHITLGPGTCAHRHTDTRAALSAPAAAVSVLLSLCVYVGPSVLTGDAPSHVSWPSMSLPRS